MFKRCAGLRVLYRRSRMYQKMNPRVPSRNRKSTFGCTRPRRILDRDARGEMTMPNHREFAKYVLACSAGILAPCGHCSVAVSFPSTQFETGQILDGLPHAVSEPTVESFP